MQVLRHIKGNQILSINYKNASTAWAPTPKLTTLFINYSKESTINFKHTDSFFFDYSFQRLLPQKFSSLGPGIAVSDINKDGLEDFFIGNGYKKKGELFIQNANGRFSSRPLETGDKRQEDTGCLFFDVDNDNDEDLLVASGTNEFPRNSPYLFPRLYLNDGKGNFTRSTEAIPAHLATVTTVAKACDFDKDGDLDLFLGGRIVSESYPSPAASYLLQNNKGVFTDVTKSSCPALLAAGMVTDAVWIDVDGDKMDDLVITGEWMPVRIFKNQQANFKEITAEAGLASFWACGVLLLEPIWIKTVMLIW